MKMRLVKFLLSCEYAWHRVDAYLFANQGKMVEHADAMSRAYEIERRLAVLEVNNVQR